LAGAVEGVPGAAAAADGAVAALGAAGAAGVSDLLADFLSLSANSAPLKALEFEAVGAGCD
jgi:hypothetical protein